jgi:hypothetical protein
MNKSNNKNHWYLKKGNFEAYEQNPFVEKAIEIISHNKIVKKQYMKGDRGVEQSIVNQDGEITGKSMFVRMIEVDEDKFAKLYLNELGILWGMKKPALKLFSYIMTILVVNKDEFYLSNKKAMDYTGYVTKTALNNALSQLFELGVIAKTTEENWYFINPLFVFNGSRVTFAKTYVKKKKEVNVNQPELPFTD